MRDEAAAILPFKLRPSRAFALQQATVMAIHDLYPALVKDRGIGWTADFVAQTFPGNSYFRAIVRDHFRAIAARYDLQDAPCR